MANISVSSVERGLAILELLVERSEGLQISEIAHHLSLPLSASHRLLQALVNTGYVRQDAPSGRYVLTLKLGAIGLRQLSEMTLARAAQPILDDLARETGELVRLAVVEGDEMTWTAEAQGATSTIRYHPPLSGHHVPLHTTGMGKAWLASMPEKEAIAKVVARGFDTALMGPNAIRAVPALRREIRKVRAMGFAFNDQESELGLSAIAMLIKDRGHANRVVGAISVAGPTFRLDREKLVSFADSLHLAVCRLEQIWPVHARASVRLGPRHDGKNDAV
jgi:DNA-binding IclR family transcriptional regulator